MITIDEAVSRSIEAFLNEEFLFEKDKKTTRKKGKNAVKKGNGQRGDFDYDHDKKNNPNISTGDQDSLANDLDSPIINIAAIAKEVYPDHTDEGAQSQLRKKIKGETSDSGTKYKLKKKEAKRLRRALHKFGLF